MRLFDHIHNNNAGSYSPSGSPVEVGCSLRMQQTLYPFTPDCRSKFKATVHWPNLGSLPISNHPAFPGSKPYCLEFPPRPQVLLAPCEENKPSQSSTALCPLITATASGKSPRWGKYTEFHQVPSSRWEYFPYHSQSTQRTCFALGVI